MASIWKQESGRLKLHWSHLAQSVRYEPVWICDVGIPPSSYVSPLPDFSNRSPFGGVAWFQPNPSESD